MPVALQSVLDVMHLGAHRTRFDIVIRWSLNCPARVFPQMCVCG
jgi:hypothetical protein